MTLAELAGDKDWVDIPLSTISWYHHLAMLPKIKIYAIAQYDAEKLFNDVASALPTIEGIEEELSNDKD